MICPFSYCPPRCDDRNPACDKKLCKRAEPICVCADGYIIGPNGDCISERQCPNCTSFSIYCYGTTSSHFTTNHFPGQFKGLSRILTWRILANQDWHSRFRYRTKMSFDVGILGFELKFSTQ